LRVANALQENKLLNARYAEMLTVKAGTPDINFEYADTHRSLFGL